MGYNPWHFWGMIPQQSPITSKCNGLVYKYPWQGADFSGRLEVIRAIETAESRLREWLGYDVAPRYSSALLDLPTYYEADLARYGGASPVGLGASIKYPYGHLITLGTEVLTLLESDVSVVTEDRDGDGLEETFSVTFSTDILDVSQFALFFNVDDRNGDGPLDEYEVRPFTRVIMEAGEVTIEGGAWLLVRPIRYEGFNTYGLNPEDVGVLAATLDVYLRTTACENQVNLIWNSTEHPCFSLEPCPDVEAGAGSTTGLVTIQHAEIGLLSSQYTVFNTNTNSWCSGTLDICQPFPQWMRVNALAGYRADAMGRMSRQWQEIVARLASAELVRVISGCEHACREIQRWQFDVSRAAGANDEQYAVSQEDLANPIGTRMGQVYAWRQVRNLRLQRSVLI